jgi:hypothetical protein
MFSVIVEVFGCSVTVETSSAIIEASGTARDLKRIFEVSLYDTKFDENAAFDTQFFAENRTLARAQQI